MPCDVESLTSIRCNDASKQAPAVQKKIWIGFLCAIATALDAEYVCPTEADPSLLCQGSVGKLQLIQAQEICELLDIDCGAQVCDDPLRQEAIVTELVCKILTEIET